MDYNTMILVLLICLSNIACMIIGARHSSRVKIIRITANEIIDIMPIEPETYKDYPLKQYADEAPEELTPSDEIYYDNLRRKQVLQHGGDITDV